MAVPVSNPSKVTRKRRNPNIGAAPAKLKGTNKDNATINKLGGYDDPTGAPKQTLLQKQDQLANRIRAGGKSKPKAAPAKELNIAPAPASIAKPKATI